MMRISVWVFGIQAFLMFFMAFLVASPAISNPSVRQLSWAVGALACGAMNILMAVALYARCLAIREPADE